MLHDRKFHRPPGAGAFAGCGLQKKRSRFMIGFAFSLRVGLSVVLAASLLPAAIGPSAAQTATREFTVPSAQRWQGHFRGPSKLLEIHARLDYPKPSGASYAMQITINGVPLTPRNARLVNKGASFAFRDKRTFSYWPQPNQGDGWLVFSSPDFFANNSPAGGGYEVVTDPLQAYRYVWDISQMLAGDGSFWLTVANIGHAPLVVRVGQP
jgi:hypothetical protein